MYMYMYMYMYMCMYVYMYMCIYVYTCICIVYIRCTLSPKELAAANVVWPNSRAPSRMSCLGVFVFACGGCFLGLSAGCSRFRASGL